MAMRLVMPFVLVGCYGSAPGKPVHVPLPPLANADITVTSESHTVMENVEKTSTTCPQGKGEGDPACTTTRYSVSEPVTRTTTTATYGTEPINYAQFRVLTDPQWDGKLARLDELSHDCQRANVPRYIGIGLLATAAIGTVVLEAAKANSTVVLVTLYGSLGLGLASYTLGYFAFGGSKCNEARTLYNELDMSEALGWTSVTGAQYVDEMKELAARFNAAHHRTGSLQFER